MPIDCRYYRYIDAIRHFLIAAAGFDTARLHHAVDRRWFSLMLDYAAIFAAWLAFAAADTLPPSMRSPRYSLFNATARCCLRLFSASYAIDAAHYYAFDAFITFSSR